MSEILMSLNHQLYSELMNNRRIELMKKFIQHGADLDYVSNVIKSQYQEINEAIEKLRNE